MSTGPPEDDFDARFADIVAHWDEESAPRRSADDAGPDRRRRGDGPPTPEAPAEAPGPDWTAPEQGPPLGRPDDPGPGARRADAPRTPGPDETPDDDEEETFVPSPPAPLPRGDLTFWAALVGLVAGPVWLLYLVMVHPDGSRVPMVLATLLTIAGFAALVSRSPRRRRGDDDDKGAVL